MRAPTAVAGSTKVIDNNGRPKSGKFKCMTPTDTSTGPRDDGDATCERLCCRQSDAPIRNLYKVGVGLGR